ncbi:MAG: PAS domain S-box protein [Gemmatimonadota bacterium]|nr:PAS domain S-box protein [Gemmatimonadota bacterium]
MAAPLDPESVPSSGAEAEEGRGAAGGAVQNGSRRSRLSRPTPSQLFAERRQAPPLTPRRPRVVPQLAGTADTAVPSPNGREGQPAEYPPDLVFIVRQDGTVLYVNRPLGRRGEEDVIGSDLFDWVFPEQHEFMRAALDRVFGGGAADGLELTGIQQHDPDAWYECRIAPNLRDGRVVSATIIARDVTRYKRAEEELRGAHDELRRLLEERSADLEQARARLAARAGHADTEQDGLERFRTLLDAAGEAIFVTDPASDTLVDANETACRWLRRSRADVVGQGVHGLGLEFPILPPLALDVQFTETRDSRRPLILEGVQRRSDGSTFPVEVAVAPHVVGGREYVLAIVRDVKGRRRAEDAWVESENRYRALLAQSFDAVFLTTRGGQVVEANPAALELFGYAQGEFVGLDARAVMPRVEDIRQFQRQMADSGVVRGLEVELRRRDGAAVAGLVSATRRRDAHEHLLGYQWVVRALGPAPAPVVPPGAAVAEPEPLVLLVDAQDAARVEAAAALGRGGLAVVTAGSSAEALQVARERGPDLRLVIVGPMGEGAPEDLARDLRAVVADVPVVLATPDDPVQVLERTADLAVAACLRHPAHPLALVQSARAALGLGQD